MIIALPSVKMITVMLEGTNILDRRRRKEVCTINFVAMATLYMSGSIWHLRGEEEEAVAATMEARRRTVVPCAKLHSRTDLSLMKTQFFCDFLVFRYHRSRRMISEPPAELIKIVICTATAMSKREDGEGASRH